MACESVRAGFRYGERRKREKKKGKLDFVAFLTYNGQFQTTNISPMYYWERR